MIKDLHIVKDNQQHIYGLNSEQRSLIKESLTFNNPAYANAKRYGRSRYISIPPYLTYYSEHSVKVTEGERKKVLTVPIGIDVEKVIDVKGIHIRDERTSNKVSYPPFVLDLRDIQVEAEAHYLLDVKRNNYPKCVTQLPTGKGKSILALHTAYTLQEKTLILVHKDDLVVGWQKDIKLCFGDNIDIGLIKAKSRKIGEQITIATVQTLSRMNEDEFSNLVNEFGFVVQDECLVGDTLIVQDDGIVKPIKECYSFTKVLGGKVSNQFSRQSNIYQVSCSHSILKGSPTHPTWCVRKKTSHSTYSVEDFEVKKLCELSKDYLIPVVVKIPHTERFNMSEELARFVACIMCDGHIDKGTSNRVKVNVQKDRGFYYDVFKKGVEELGGTLKYSNDVRGNVTFWSTDKEVKNYLNVVCKIPTGKKSDVLSICDFVYGIPLNSIKAFIETCFNCEGDLSVGRSCRINFNTCSEQFAQGLSMLLKKFGILSNIQEIKREEDNHNTIYRLSVCGVFFNMFMDTFTLLPRKMTKQRNRGRKNLNRFVGDYYLSDIKSVDNLEYTDTVYDFEVSDTHSFVANGVYTHNCHHVGLNIFNIINRFNSKYKLGLSATPKRSDGLDFVFDLFFGGIGYKYEAGADDEDICSVKVKVLDSKAVYRPFYFNGQVFNEADFKKEELPSNITYVEDMDYTLRPKIPYLTIDDSAVKNENTLKMVCEKIIKYYYNSDYSILVLFTQKDHIRLYGEYLKQYIPEEKVMYYYGDSNESSEEMMKKAENKEVSVTLATYAKATEGTNVKAWEVLFLVSSLNNEKNVEQAIGRIRRRKAGKINPVIVYDVQYSGCYSLRRHYDTRLRVYRRLKFQVESRRALTGKKSLFSRGYH